MEVADPCRPQISLRRPTEEAQQLADLARSLGLPDLSPKLVPKTRLVPRASVVARKGPLLLLVSGLRAST